MSSTNIKHINPSGAVPPYRDLFSSVTIVPKNTSLAFISTQWAGDENSEVISPGNYHEQAKVVWTNVGKILKEMGCGMKDVVHRNVSFLDFNDDIGKDVVTAVMEVMPDEKEHWWSSSLTYRGCAHFHKPGIVYSVELIVAVP